MTRPGWGSAPYGRAPWGGATITALSISSLVAVAENVVRIGFTRPIYISSLLDTLDGGDPTKYTVTPLPNTVGVNGEQARPVTIVSVDRLSDTTLIQAANVRSYVLLTLDRSMTPFPSGYVASVADVYSEDLSENLAFDSRPFAGMAAAIMPHSLDVSTATRDFANPQTLDGASMLPQPMLALLGVFAADETGDYAFDQGIVAYKKRIYRRLITRPGGFLHLGDYGIGVPQQGKKLGLARTMSHLVAEAEKQIAQEPETETVSVRAKVEQTGLVRFTIAIRMRDGRNIKFGAPFPTQ